MPRETLLDVVDFPSLVSYLAEELDWPLDADAFEDLDALTFEYSPDELNLPDDVCAKVRQIKQMRPLVTRQPWAVFYIEFESKRLPVTALRRVLNRFVEKKRASVPDRATWKMQDLLFVNAHGAGDDRGITFAHFSKPEAGYTSVLREFMWTRRETHFAHIRNYMDCLRWPEDGTSQKQWREQWRAAFVGSKRKAIRDSRELAQEMAHFAREVRLRVAEVLEITREKESDPLQQLYAAFRKLLIHDLPEDDFADAYAQTMAYGLFAARAAHPDDPFQLKDAPQRIPPTNPFLRGLFEQCLGRAGVGGGRLDIEELGVGRLVELFEGLQPEDMRRILDEFGSQTGDPVIHFYEDFLAAYDKQRKVKRGVFYTPQPVVSYIVRSVQELLQTEFGLEDGLASTVTWREFVDAASSRVSSQDKRQDAASTIRIPDGVDPDSPFVNILDPATGTATFLVEVIDVIHRTLVEKWGRQGHSRAVQRALWNQYVPKHLLPRLHGYELMMAPYTIAHMKIGLKLRETEFTAWQSLGPKDRVRIYLTNALEPASDDEKQREFEEWVPALAHEAKAVNAIKRDQRFTVVIGNPPYAGVSVNRGNWITDLIDLYRFVDGQPLEEKKIWVKNDYVKFLRLSQFLVDTAKRGIVGMITDHSYLDSPTFRGLRNSLHRSFSFARILNLHGNSKRRETNPEGGIDENVFDITQGVAIGLFIKNRRCTSPTSYADLWGKRRAKYSQLSLGPNLMKCWLDVVPTSPVFLFTPVSSSTSDEYASGWLMTDIFPLGSNGVQTSRDSLVLAPSREELTRRFDWIRKSSVSSLEIREVCNVEDKSFWSLDKAREALRADKSWMSRVTDYTYRPFDNCWLYSSPDFVHRLRREVMQHMERPNLALCVGRAGLVVEGSWNLVFATKAICDHNLFYRGSSLNSPLYRYEHSDELYAGTQDGRPNRSPNLGQRFSYALARILDLGFEPEKNIPKGLTAEEIFSYIYAVLHSPGYRSRYAEFLKIDFPRVPLTGNPELFRGLAQFGGELVDLHLFEATKLDGRFTPVKGSGEFEVEKVSYSDETVWIDKAKTRGFRGVPEQVWNFHIGGYQVCEKWLKDRQAKGGKNPRPGRVLTDEDIAHYQKIVVALNETIRIMAEIDEVIDAHGGWPDAFSAGGVGAT